MDQPAAIAPLDREALVRWLASESVVDSEGRVWSWHNPRHPGYAYPEAGGLWLGLVARLPPSAELDAMATRVSAWLDRCTQRDRVGRDGRRYLFDHGMVLAGQLAWARRRGSTGDCIVRPALDAVLSMLDRGAAVDPWPPVAETHPRWSEWLGPHQLKLALPLTRAIAFDPPRIRAALTQLFDGQAPPAPDGRVITCPDGQRTYVHAHCYAAEGLWQLSEALPDPDARRHARSQATHAIEWLATVQRPDGGIPSWHDGHQCSGPAAADVAAQAIRLWAGFDRQRYRAAIDRSVAFLARLADPGGGLRYSEQSDDRNTWATVFAVQAIEFARGEACIGALV